MNQRDADQWLSDHIDPSNVIGFLVAKGDINPENAAAYAAEAYAASVADAERSGEELPLVTEAQQIGLAYTDSEGIERRILRESYTAIYPYTHRIVRFIAEPTPRGRASAAYKKVRSRLGDDWVSDITDSECLVNTLALAGCSELAIGVLLDEAHSERMRRMVK